MCDPFSIERPEYRQVSEVDQEVFVDISISIETSLFFWKPIACAQYGQVVVVDFAVFIYIYFTLCILFWRRIYYLALSCRVGNTHGMVACWRGFGRFRKPR